MFLLVFALEPVFNPKLNTSMSRRPPQILLQQMLGTTWKQLTIVESQGLWAVVYQDQPFGYRTEQMGVADLPDRKYPKTVFPNPGHAVNLARKLNRWFETEDFTVKKIL
jgi:hypothetical protein